ncbi:MAG: hypothetical protein ACYDBJ_10690 [Aggregatilineales bacterium]
MDRKLSVVANVRYQTPKGKGASKLKRLLRYIQYRDDRDGHIPQQRGLERWTDHGLGDNFQTIATNCDAAKSDYVQAFTFVINPNPDLIALIPEDRRASFVEELTESTIDNFLAERGIEDLEYSYALHRRETTDAEDPGRDNPHTHVILPGTYFSWQDGDRLPLYMNRNKRENHIELLHQVAQQEIDRLLQQEIGRDWEQRYDLWTLEREALRLLAEVTEPEPPPLDIDLQPEARSPGLSLDL